MVAAMICFAFEDVLLKQISATLPVGQVLALTGAMDRRIVNITDDAPVTLYDMASYVGDPIEGSAEPLINPWAGRMDGSLARELGFTPTVPTIHAAAREGIL